MQFRQFKLNLQTTLEFVGIRHRKWVAQIIFDKKKYFGGLHDNEQHAAMSVNLLCDKFSRDRKNPMIDIRLNKIQKTTEKKSQYKGVYWHKPTGKWCALIKPKGQKLKNGGKFYTEVNAAKKANQLCEELGIPHKNPDIGAIPTINEKLQAKEKLAVIIPKGQQQIHGGSFQNELDAANKVIKICEELAIPQDKPRIGAIQNDTITSCDIWSHSKQKRQLDKKLSQNNNDELFNHEEDTRIKFQNQISQYLSRFKHNTCKVQLIQEKTKCYSGIFNNEEQNSKTTNFQCEKFQIESTNPELEFYENCQETKHKIHEVTAQTICNEKVKAKIENLLHEFKSGSEETFIKTNAEERSALFLNDDTDKRKKRKQKQDSTAFRNNEVEVLGEIKNSNYSTNKVTIKTQFMDDCHMIE